MSGHEVREVVWISWYSHDSTISPGWLNIFTFFLNRCSISVSIISSLIMLIWTVFFCNDPVAAINFYHHGHYHCHGHSMLFSPVIMFRMVLVDKISWVRAVSNCLLIVITSKRSIFFSVCIMVSPRFRSFTTICENDTNQNHGRGGVRWSAHPGPFVVKVILSGGHEYLQYQQIIISTWS